MRTDPAHQRPTLRRLALTIALPAARVAVMAAGFRRVHHAVERVPLARRPASADRVERLVADVDWACRNGRYKAPCVPRSLVLATLLRRLGQPAVVQVGVRREADALAAHAWVECAGEPVGEPDDIAARFAAFELARTIDLTRSIDRGPMS